MGDIVRTSARSPVLLIDATGITAGHVLLAQIVSATGKTVIEKEAAVANASVAVAVHAVLPNGAYVVRLLDREQVLREYVFVVSPEGGAAADEACFAW